MQRSKTIKKNGFTLIEVMVVISTIAFLVSIVVVSTGIAKAKARDAKKIAETKETQNAITAMYADKGYVPHNYDCTSDPCQVSTTRTTLEIEDLPGATPTESGKAYAASMKELVDNKVIADIPRTTTPNSAPYIYYDYGKGPIGAVFGTILETASVNNPNGYPVGSCRTTLLQYGVVCPVGFIVDPLNHQCVQDYSSANFCANLYTKDFCACFPYK